MTSKKQYKGILLIMVSAFCFALMSMFVKLAGDLPAVQKSFFRNIVAVVMASSILWKDPSVMKVEKRAWPDLILRSVFGTVGILCNFYAVDHLVLSDATMLNKMSPFFAVLFSFLILKEKVKFRQVVLILGAFLGSMLVIKPTFSNMDLFPSLMGFAGGMAAGAAYTMVRKLGTEGVKGPFVVFFFSTFSCLATLPWLIFDYHPMTIVQLMCLIGAGLAASGGQFSITAAYFYAPAKEISIYDYSIVIFSAMMGFVIFGQVPDIFSWIGYGVIMLMALLMFLGNRKKESSIN